VPGPERLQEEYVKITDVRVRSLMTSNRSKWGDVHTDWTFVQIETDEGIAGLGEGSNIAGNGSLIVGDVLMRAKHLLIGQDPVHIDRIWHRIYRYYTYLGSRGAVSAAISAVDTALWDIKGKAVGRPVWDLLGGKHRESVPLYANEWFEADHTPEEAAVVAKKVVAQGFGAIKFDPFTEGGTNEQNPYTTGIISRRGQAEGIDRIAAVREAVGPDIEILIDLLARYNVPCAIRVARAMEPYDVDWMEEPVPPESLAALRTVRENTNVPISVGERCFTRWDFREILEQGLADYIMPDPNWTGGLTELRKIAAVAEMYNVPMSCHDVNGPMQVVQGATAMIGVPNFYRNEFSVNNIEEYNAALNHPLDIREGSLYLPDRPGHGYELDDEYAATHKHPDWHWD